MTAVQQHSRAHAAAPRSEKPHTAFFSSVIKAVSAAAPAGSTVRVIGMDEQPLLRAGYKITDGSSDVTVARGGYAEFEAARKTRTKKLILVPTHDVAAAASDRYLSSKTNAVKLGKKPFAAVFDPDGFTNLASIFGELVSLELCAFDGAFCAYMRGEPADGELTDKTGELVKQATEKLKPVQKDFKRAASVLAAYAAKAARLAERYPTLIDPSGAGQATQAYFMLCAAEDRPHGLRGETEMLFSEAVSEFYVKNLAPKRTLFPPDNARRIDAACNYFKIDVRRACAFVTGVYPPQKMRLCEYRRDEFRAELARMLVGLNTRRAAARSVFKRLYPDDGYGLKTLVEPTDAALCVALAPDVCPSDGMLSFIKQTGALERYII